VPEYARTPCVCVCVCFGRRLTVCRAEIERCLRADWQARRRAHVQAGGTTPFKHLLSAAEAPAMAAELVRVWEDTVFKQRLSAMIDGPEPASS
jgi:hypothetical protein